MSENIKQQLLIWVIEENSDPFQILGYLEKSDDKPTRICLFFELDDSQSGQFKKKIKEQYRIELEISCFKGSEKEGKIRETIKRHANSEILTNDINSYLLIRRTIPDSALIEERNGRWVVDRYPLGIGNHKLDGLDARITEANFRASVVAKFPARVLIHGGTGTGKSRLVRFINENSGRRRRSLESDMKVGGRAEDPLYKLIHKQSELVSESRNKKSAQIEDEPLVEINLAGLSASLIESELFGYLENSFSGAKEKDGHVGLFMLAHGSTLFLDEIAECPLDVQAKLLTVIQKRETEDEKNIDYPCYIKPVGSSEEVLVDVRVIVATHKDLRREIALGKFREDLYFRLAEYVIELPPWCDLTEDCQNRI